MFKNIMIIVIASFCLSSCAVFDSLTTPASSTKIVPARLYDLADGKVINVTFNFSGTTQGKISFSLPSGEKYDGEYQTLRGGSSAWGQIYSSGLGRTNAYTEVNPNEYVGSAVVVGDQGGSIQCEYVTNTSSTDPHGQGGCKDNKGKFFKLMY